MSLAEQVIHRGVSSDYTAYGKFEALSFKCMFNGSAWYETDDGGRFLVNDNHYLLLNSGQGYWVHKQGETAVHTFCLFLPTYMVEDVAHTWLTPQDKLLQNPYRTTTASIRFYERCYRHNNHITPTLWSIFHQLQRNELTDAWLEEQLHYLLLQLLHRQRNLGGEVDKMPAVRLPTKQALYQALHRGREFIHASYHHPISLNDIAAATGLSPHHFLRTFHRAFGQTPHAYLTDLRLQKARYLLAKTKQPITTICFDVGFASLGSFSTLFSQHVGLSPRAYRNTSTS